MIIVVPYQFPCLIFLFEKKFRFEKFFIPYIPSQGLFPEKDPQLVTQVEKCFPLGIVAAPQKIASLIFDHLKVGRHKRRGNGSPELGMTVMAVVSHQPQFFAVEKKLCAPGLDDTETDAAGFFILSQDHPEPVEMGDFRRPEFEVGHIEFIHIFFSGKFIGQDLFPIDFKGDFPGFPEKSVSSNSSTYAAF
jgi:hypothetical protein